MSSFGITDDPEFQTRQKAMREKALRARSDSVILEYAGLEADKLGEFRRRLTEKGALDVVALIDAFALLDTAAWKGIQWDGSPRAYDESRKVRSLFSNTSGHSG
jgi:hypothetical protein